ncbi:hypothetical protein [Maribacter sp. 2-571]|uniref:hypothetical protein n=1 Tax=Maribacter sp. 2-571 TaxID=3417569 RepID=UPI003D343226
MSLEIKKKYLSLLKTNNLESIKLTSHLKFDFLFVDVNTPQGGVLHMMIDVKKNILPKFIPLCSFIYYTKHDKANSFLLKELGFHKKFSSYFNVKSFSGKQYVRVVCKKPNIRLITTFAKNPKKEELGRFIKQFKNQRVVVKLISKQRTGYKSEEFIIRSKKTIKNVSYSIYNTLLTYCINNLTVFLLKGIRFRIDTFLAFINKNCPKNLTMKPPYRIYQKYVRSSLVF